MTQVGMIVVVVISLESDQGLNPYPESSPDITVVVRERLKRIVQLSKVDLTRTSMGKKYRICNKENHSRN